MEVLSTSPFNPLKTSWRSMLLMTVPEFRESFEGRYSGKPFTPPKDRALVCFTLVARPYSMEAIYPFLQFLTQLDSHCVFHCIRKRRLGNEDSRRRKR